MKSCKLKDDGTLNLDQIQNLKRIMGKIPGDGDIQRDADRIKAISDPTRLKIMYLLKYGEMCVCEIFTCLEKSQPTVSHHLNILKKAGFIKYRKEGVWVYYSLSQPGIIEVLVGLLAPK